MSENNNIKLSGVIIAFNEEKNIERCLLSLKNVVDEIIVVDSFSTDKTQEICHKHGAIVIQHAFENYILQHRYADSQASYNHILNLDADEELSENLKESILNAKSNFKFTGYKINRLTNYCGKWIKHCGWYPDAKLRLYDRREGNWEGVLIHEKFELHDKTREGKLNGDIFHYSFYTIDEHKKQTEKFTDISANELFLEGKRANWFKINIKPIWKFISDYIFKLGFLDGKYGFIISRISAKGTHLKYRKLKKHFES